MKLNRGGLKFCAVYLCYFAVLAGFAITADDPKGAFFIEQLAIFPAGLFLAWTGLLRLMEAHVGTDSWLNSWLLTVPLSLVLVYLFGWITSTIIGFRDPYSTPVGEDTPDWHKR